MNSVDLANAIQTVDNKYDVRASAITFGNEIAKVKNHGRKTGVIKE